MLIVVFFINLCGSKCKTCTVQSRSIYCKDLESRTCITGRAFVCTVQTTVGRLLTTSTDKSFDLTGLLIDDGQGSLRLWREVDIFIISLTFLKKTVTECINSFLGGFLGSEEKSFIVVVCIGSELLQMSCSCLPNHRYDRS